MDLSRKRRIEAQCRKKSALESSEKEEDALCLVFGDKFDDSVPNEA